MLTTTRSASSRARSTRRRWPSCRYPMVGTNAMVWRRERSARDQERISARLESSRKLELALLHLRKEVATLDVIVRAVGRQRRVVALARLRLGLGRLRHILLNQLRELFVV